MNTTLNLLSIFPAPTVFWLLAVVVSDGYVGLSSSRPTSEISSQRGLPLTPDVTLT